MVQIKVLWVPQLMERHVQLVCDVKTSGWWEEGGREGGKEGGREGRDGEERTNMFS
jgi:hypothetical protein